jgi:hypothetical protein
MMVRNRLRSVAVFALLLCVSGCAALTGGAAPKAPVKIVLAGASVSAGFGTPLRMWEVIDAGIDDPILTVDVTDFMFFRNPPAFGKKVIEVIRRESPAVIVGVDLLFWFAYGYQDLAWQERQLGRVLAELATFRECSIILGDIPAYTPGPLLPARLIPSDATRKRLNTVIRDWAAGRDNVCILPLASIMKAMRGAAGPVQIGGRKLVLNEDELLLGDHLHLTLKGMSLLGALVLAELNAADAALADRRVESDWERLYRRVQAYREAKKKHSVGGAKGAGTGAAAAVPR